MTLFVIHHPAPLCVLRGADGDIAVFEPTERDLVIVEAPPSFAVGDLDFSQPGDPLSEVV